MRNRIRIASLTPLFFLIACDHGTSPTRDQTRVIFVGTSPAPGATIQTSTTQFGGAFIDRGSGKLTLSLRVEAGSDESVARLNVYGRDASGQTCMQNLPDTPDLGPLKRGDVRSIEITGFQVYRLPCEVASFRAVLHRRADTHLNTEITPSELIAESTLTARYAVR